MTGLVNRRYRLDDFELDVQNLRLLYKGEVRPLEPKCFRLLQFLVENSGKTVTKERIIATVWGDTFVTDNSITRAITLLRKALHDDAKEAKYIETIPTIGYRFIGDCKEIENNETLPLLVPAQNGDKVIDRHPDIEKEKPRPGLRWRPWLAAAFALVLLTIATQVYFRKSSVQAPEMRLDVYTPVTSDSRSFAISPDGRALVYVASGDDRSRLWLRKLDSTTAEPLAITDGEAAYPFWSPDSRSVGFFSDGKLKRVEVSGGSPQTLANASSGRGGTWSSDGVILFAPTQAGPLFRVPSSGGEAVAVTKLDRSDSHRFPKFLPDGRYFLFYAEEGPDKPGPRSSPGAIYLGSLDSANTKRLTAADTAGEYMPPGWLVWVRDGILVAAPLSLTRRALSGDPVTMADAVFFDSSYAPFFSVSLTGSVVYRRGMPSWQLRWFDRSGKALGTFSGPGGGDVFPTPRISPDGHRVAVSHAVQGNSDIWLLALPDGHTRRLTFDAAIDQYPVWSPDGTQIIFASNRNGKWNLYVKPSDGSRSETSLADFPFDGPSVIPLDWSPDKRFVLYNTFDSQTGYDLWVLSLEGGGKRRLFLKTKYDETGARFSPDGRWVAYISDESGRQEIYLRPFADVESTAVGNDRAGVQWQVSAAGGRNPVWRHDGKELYYIGQDGQMMAVQIAAAGTALQLGSITALFQTRSSGGGFPLFTGARQYDVAPDGRFLLNTSVSPSPMTLLLNWKSK